MGGWKRLNKQLGRKSRDKNTLVRVCRIIVGPEDEGAGHIAELEVSKHSLGNVYTVKQ